MSAAALDADTLWLAASIEARRKNVSWASTPSNSHRFLQPNGTQVHTNSKHLGSLATCLQDSAATAATPAVEQDSSRMAGLSGDVTVTSKAAGKTLFPSFYQDTSHSHQHAGCERLLS